MNKQNKSFEPLNKEITERLVQASRCQVEDLLEELSTTEQGLTEAESQIKPSQV